MASYNILERGKTESGGTWARYTYGPNHSEGRIKVMAGRDLDATLARRVAEKERRRKAWDALTPEEQCLALKQSIKRNARFQAMAGYDLPIELRRALDDELSEAEWQAIYQRHGIAVGVDEDRG